MGYRAQLLCGRGEKKVDVFAADLSATIGGTAIGSRTSPQRFHIHFY